MDSTLQPGHGAFGELQGISRIPEHDITDSIIESIPGAFYMLDAMGRYVRWNAFQRDVIVGSGDREMAGCNAMETFHPDDRAEAVQRMQRVLETGVEDIAEGRVLLRGGPDYRWFLMTGRRAIIGGMPFIIGTGVDITDRKRAEEENEKLGQQLQHSQKMEIVGKLAGGIAHDFNNMLAVILGHAEALLEETPEDSDGRDHLDSILKAANRSADLTRQLLSFARRQVVLPKVLELDQAIADTMSLLHRLIGEHIELDWRPGAGGVRIRIDPSQVDQILTNLCVNARDAIGRNGTVTISSSIVHLGERAFPQERGERKAGEYAVLTVEDTGSGMEPEVLPHIFEPFFTTKELGKGTGLGLSTIYGIVKQNSGFIDVSSEPGRGSRFSIHLPVVAEDGSVCAGSGSVAECEVPGRSDGRVVLIVEDEPDILKLCRFVLEARGFAVLSAPSPGEAVSLARSHGGSIDLLLTDVILPKMNGSELASRISELHPGIRVLYMSGYTADVIDGQGVSARGVRFIQKPFSVRELASKVGELLTACS
ncbi:ATP-binding protein [Chlorobium sp. N1]|uniref:ATP-binding protein n=1 Tax=Chlorobium sp. N1 TaxID=2491138 RepID=UPI00103C7BA1|nr:ATP-binding protein [Chlorobium sp. N1]TCD48471.1 response regulator [Chlorobium sp. N1]